MKTLITSELRRCRLTLVFCALTTCIFSAAIYLQEWDNWEFTAWIICCSMVSGIFSISHSHIGLDATFRLFTSGQQNYIFAPLEKFLALGLTLLSGLIILPKIVLELLYALNIVSTVAISSLQVLYALFIGILIYSNIFCLFFNRKWMWLAGFAPTAYFAMHAHPGITELASLASLAIIYMAAALFSNTLDHKGFSPKLAFHIWAFILFSVGLQTTLRYAYELGYSDENVTARWLQENLNSDTSNSDNALEHAILDKLTEGLADYLKLEYNSRSTFNIIDLQSRLVSKPSAKALNLSLKARRLMLEGEEYYWNDGIYVSKDEQLYLSRRGPVSPKELQDKDRFHSKSLPLNHISNGLLWNDNTLYKINAKSKQFEIVLRLPSNERLNSIFAKDAYLYIHTSDHLIYIRKSDISFYDNIKRSFFKSVKLMKDAQLIQIKHYLRYPVDSVRGIEKRRDGSLFVWLTQSGLNSDILAEGIIPPPTSVTHKLLSATLAPNKGFLKLQSLFGSEQLQHRAVIHSGDILAFFCINIGCYFMTFILLNKVATQSRVVTFKAWHIPLTLLIGLPFGFYLFLFHFSKVFELRAMQEHKHQKKHQKKQES